MKYFVHSCKVLIHLFCWLWQLQSLQTVKLQSPFIFLLIQRVCRCESVGAVRLSAAGTAGALSSAENLVHSGNSGGLQNLPPGRN